MKPDQTSCLLATMRPKRAIVRSTTSVLVFAEVMSPGTTILESDTRF
jgi:hypothetical protein